MSTKYNKATYTHMKKVLYLIIGAICIGSLGCNNRSEDTYIAPELQTYFDSFKAEGNSRNVAIDYSLLNIHADFSDLEEGNVVGKCVTYADDVKKLIIDQSYWDKSSSLQRELLIFHELGHCILHRGHTESATNRGRCLSLMTSGEGSCKLHYTFTTRTQYLDELFSN